LQTPLFAEVRTYPAPSGEPFSAEYQVMADGQTVAVYTARVLDPPFAGKEYDYGGSYAFANFDLKGKAEIRVTAKRSLRNAVIRPAHPELKTRLDGDHTLVISLKGPVKFSLEPDGKKGPLLLFANPMERNSPKPGDKNVLFFGPGVHRPERIILTNNQTLYLAGGAVVKGGILAQGKNILICGRGILDGSDWEWRRGPTPTVVSIQGTNVEVSGITIRGASHWTVVPRNSRKVTIRNVKLCNSRVQNDDGINPCNSQDVLITDCFIRSDDDCVALKGLDFSGANSNVERITVENCILWSDRARIFLLGHESRARFMRQVTLRNLEIIHFVMTPFLFEPGEEMRLEDVRVENVRIHAEGQRELIRLRPVVNQYMKNRVPGHIRDVQFLNITVSGNTTGCLVQLDGPDANHEVQRVLFRHVLLGDESLSATSSHVQIGPHAQDIKFQ
jgi:hypothetical protein